MPDIAVPTLVPAASRVGDRDVIDRIFESVQAGGAVDQLAHLDGLTLSADNEDLDDPILLTADGQPIDTWREGYPYAERIPRADYERAKRQLQIELLKMQTWVADTGQRVVILFEGRDAAGKGGTIKRFTEHLNPRGRPGGRAQQAKPGRVRPVVLPALPAAAADRRGRSSCSTGPGTTAPVSSASWASATTSSTSGSCSRRPHSSGLLTGDGVHLLKLWFSVSRGEQRARFLVRRIDPVRRWKLSPIDLASLDKWDAYTAAKEAMFRHTDTEFAPWTVIKSNDKKRARIETLRFVLSQLDYPDKDLSVVGRPDPLLVGPAAEVYEMEELAA